MSTTPIKSDVLFLAKHHRTFNVTDIKHELKTKVTRQYISRVINELVKSGELVKMGSGRWTRYALPEEIDKLSERIKKNLTNNKALNEDKVYSNLRDSVAGLRSLNENVDHIINYGFTEMLNNAIDHSKSKSISVGISVEPEVVKFKVSDNGIGVFRNLMTQRNLTNELEAIQDLTKGKITTKKENHTGEGIFFTSRAADLFILESFGYRLRVDNKIDDIFIEKIDKSVKGTSVEFEIDRNSKRDLGSIFRKFQTDDFQFGITEIKVKLYKEGVEYISRSQAKRLLLDLDKFKRIILDFKDVKSVGQGFSDEIFRVFQSSHPDISLAPVNMNSEVEFMIKRVDSPLKLL